MFINKPKEVPYVSIFKTSAGEEFIATVIAEDHTSFTIEKARCLVGTETGGLQFAPFLMLADPEASIDVPKPMITAKPLESLEVQYGTAVSRIARPSTGKIIT